MNFLITRTHTTISIPAIRYTVETYNGNVTIYINDKEYDTFNVTIASQTMSTVQFKLNETVGSYNLVAYYNGGNNMLTGEKFAPVHKSESFKVIYPTFKDLNAFIISELAVIGSITFYSWKCYFIN